MKRLIEKILPPKSWQRPVIILMGILTGIVFVAAHLSNATSYLSDEPEACVNCHVMTPHYATWFHSSHRERANCNDCHVPHDNVIKKYLFKAQDGLRHASIFSTYSEPQVIMIKDAGKSVVQQNCIRCHEHTVNPISASNVTFENHQHGKGHLCWDCHRQVPHGRVLSEASTPYARIPKQNPVIPKWLKKLTNDK